MNIAICDDEAYYVNDIFKRLMTYKETNDDVSLYVDSFYDSRELMNSIMKKDYDLFYLDIELNDGNGINIAQMIHNIQPECMIIFITSHMNYFNQSFLVNAFQYMKKPVKEQFFISELERAMKRLEDTSRSFVFHTTEGNIVFDTKEILYIETAYREYKIHSTRGAFYGTLKSITEIKKALLECDFFKIQRSFIVNLEHIERYDSATITMTNKDMLPISKKKYKEFKEVFFKYLESQ